MLKRSLFFLISVTVSSVEVDAQIPQFTRQDSLRGSITPEREWWDLGYYHLDIAVNPGDSSIKGKNTIAYTVLKKHNLMQVDLQPPMTIEKATSGNKELKYKRDGNAWFIKLEDEQSVGSKGEIVVYYSGKPRVAANPPWDGGLTWQKDRNGNPFVATSCQGEGASMWWPCKDHMYDEPDSMMISVTVPQNLTEVSNGRLVKVESDKKKKTKTYHWFVSNPINNYAVNVNIGDYVHFGEKYEGEKGILDCDFYVLRYNLKKAKQQFKDARRTLEAFEHWFGPYPFYEDSYKLVEVPYLGMEHQSSVTYGNGYENGYRGTDLSLTGWGLKFDFIIIHESGHEWFGNNITYKDIADMWIHESFTAYSENLFLDYHYGKDASADYVIGTRSAIENDIPIIGYYDVNYSGSGDMYYKGANMLHMFRQLVNDDEKWRSILREMNEKFYHQTVTTQQVEEYLSQRIGRNLSAVFDQYLRTTMIPVFEYRIVEGSLMYRWSNAVDDFDLPVKVYINGKEQWLVPSIMWKYLPDVQEGSEIKVDRNFYVGTFDEMGTGK